MNRQEYIELVNEWNNFLIIEERIISEQKILLETIINEGFLEKLTKKGVKKSVATAALIAHMLSILPSEGRAETITHRDVVDAAETHGKKVDVEDAKEGLKVAKWASRNLDADGKSTEEWTPDGSTESEGLVVVPISSGEAPTSIKASWKTVKVISEKVKTLEKLRQLTQADIDEAAKRIGVRSISYGLHYLQTTSTVKFDANLEKMKSFIEEYKSGSSFNSVKKVSKFLEKQAEKENFEPVLEVAFAYAAIKTCSDLPDACSEFKDGFERTTTQARYSGNVKGAPGSGEKITFQGVAELSDRFADSAGEIFKKNLKQASNALYKMSEQIKKGEKVSLSKISGAGLVCGVVHRLITTNGELEESKIKSLFNKVNNFGNFMRQHFESGQGETDVDSHLSKYDGADSKRLNTDKIVQKQKDFLDAELSNESLLEIFNIV